MQLFFGVERIPPSKRETYDDLMRHRGQGISGTRKTARDIYLAFFDYLQKVESEWIERSISLRVGVDEGSDVSVRVVEHRGWL